MVISTCRTAKSGCVAPWSIARGESNDMPAGGKSREHILTVRRRASGRFTRVAKPVVVGIAVNGPSDLPKLARVLQSIAVRVVKDHALDVADQQKPILKRLRARANRSAPAWDVATAIRKQVK